MRTKLLCAALCWALPAASAIVRRDAEQPFRQFFKSLLREKGALVADVNYTGVYSSEIPGFQWQRGEGSGWTRGRRVTLSRIEPRKLENLRRLYREAARVQSVSLGDTTAMCTYFERSAAFYGFRVERDGTFHFLRATTEGEICVPSDWTTRDRYAHPAPGAAVAGLPKRQQRLVALARLWAGVKRNFVFYDRIAVDWDSLYAAFIPQMERTKTDREATRLLERMVAYAGDGHTYVYPVRDDRSSVPLTTVLLDGKVYVDKVLGSSLSAHGVRRGQEVVRVDGRDVRAWAERHVRSYVAASTEQWRDYLTFCGHALVTRRDGEALTLDLRDGGRVFRVKCVAGRDKRNLPADEPAVSYRRLRNGVGYLRIRNFMDADLRRQFDAVYPELLESEALVIDLRDNGGGNSGNGDYILRHLTADTLRTASWRSPQYVPALVSWGIAPADYRVSGGFLPARPDVRPYTRPVAVLVNRGTFSAAEDFAAVLQGNGRACLVGELTGGSTGNGVRLVLQPGVSCANICAKHDVAPGGDDFTGRGLRPDIRVDEDYRSYFLASETAALGAALKLLAR